MLEPYGILALAGLCVLLAIWIHAQQTRRRPPPVAGGREGRTIAAPMRARRAGHEPDYKELQAMARAGGLPTYRLEDAAPPPGLLAVDQPRQREMLLQMPGESLLLVLRADFPQPCPAEALAELLEGAGLALAADGLYRKTQAHYGSPVAVYYVASDRATGSFVAQGKLVESLARITFFTRLPLPVNGLHVFAGMLRVAEDACERFGGELRDEQDAPLTRERSDAMVREVEAFASSHSSLDQVSAH